MKVTLILPAVGAELRNEDHLKLLSQDGLQVTAMALSSGPRSVQSRVDEAHAVPGMLVNAKKAEEDGANALVIDCMGDPGLGPLREAVNIPVLGVAQTSMAICSSLCKKFGIVTVLDRVVPLFDDLVAIYGYQSRYAGCRSVDVPVLELESRMNEVTESLFEEALNLITKDGADGIILGCTGFLGCAEAIREKLRAKGFRVPVVDPVPTTVSAAITLIRNDLSHSRVTYPHI